MKGIGVWAGDGSEELASILLFLGTEYSPLI